MGGGHVDPAAIVGGDAPARAGSGERDAQPPPAARVEAEGVIALEAREPHPVPRVDGDPIGPGATVRRACDPSSSARGRPRVHVHDPTGRRLGEPECSVARDGGAVRLEVPQVHRAQHAPGGGVELHRLLVVVKADPDGAVGRDRDRAGDPVASPYVDRPQDALVILSQELAGHRAFDPPVAIDVPGGLDRSVTVTVDAVLEEPRDLGHRALAEEGAIGDVDRPAKVDRGARRTIAARADLRALLTRRRRAVRAVVERRVVLGGLGAAPRVELGDGRELGVRDPGEVELGARLAQRERPVRVEDDAGGVVVVRRPRDVPRHFDDRAPGPTIATLVRNAFVDLAVAVLVVPVADLRGSGERRSVEVVAVPGARAHPVVVLVPIHRNVGAGVAVGIAAVDGALLTIVAARRGPFDAHPGARNTELSTVAEHAVVARAPAGRRVDGGAVRDARVPHARVHPAVRAPRLDRRIPGARHRERRFGPAAQHHRQGGEERDLAEPHAKSLSRTAPLRKSARIPPPRLLTRPLQRARGSRLRVIVTEV